MAASLDAELKSRYDKIANLERIAMNILDNFINSVSDNNRARIVDIVKYLNSSAISKEIRQYIGSVPSLIIDFISRRKYLWRRQGEEIQMQPTFYRNAIVDLVDSIVKNRNRAPLGEILRLLQTYHRQVLPYLPTPATSNSMEAIEMFLCAFPELFRLINSADGSEWTHAMPFDQINVECIAVVVDGIILLNVRPTMPSSPPRSSSQQAAATNETPAEIQGVAEIVSITPAFGFLQSDTYGPIFFTSAVCGGGNLQTKGLKMGNRMFFEAKQVQNSSQSFKNIPVKWRAFSIRPLTAEEREALLVDLQAASSMTRVSPLAASGASALAQSSSSGRLAASNSASPAPKSQPPPAAASASGTSLRRDPIDRGNSDRFNGLSRDLQAHLQTIEDELSFDVDQNGDYVPYDSMEAALENDQNDRLEQIPAIGESTSYDELEMERENQLNMQLEQATAAAAAASAFLPVRTERPASTTTAAGMASAIPSAGLGAIPKRNQAAASASVNTHDVAVQTEITDEELALRLLRTAPELLDMLQISLRR